MSPASGPDSAKDILNIKVSADLEAASTLDASPREASASALAPTESSAAAPFACASEALQVPSGDNTSHTPVSSPTPVAVSAAAACEVFAGGSSGGTWADDERFYFRAAAAAAAVERGAPAGAWGDLGPEPLASASLGGNAGQDSEQHEVAFLPDAVECDSGHLGERLAAAAGGGLLSKLAAAGVRSPLLWEREDAVDGPCPTLSRCQRSPSVLTERTWTEPEEDLPGTGVPPVEARPSGEQTAPPTDSGRATVGRAPDCGLLGLGSFATGAAGMLPGPAPANAAGGGGASGISRWAESRLESQLKALAIQVCPGAPRHSHSLAHASSPGRSRR